MRKVKLILKILLFLVIGCYSVTMLNEGTAANNNHIIFQKTPEYITYLEKVLKNEIGEYIKSKAPNSTLSPDSVLKICQDYDLKIAFVLAQGHIESHFGTAGVAARTNSVFNVGTFDNGVILYSYLDPNLSIKPYASLISRRYLVNGKTEEDLLKPKKFVNWAGKRYASLKVYEYRVKKVYNEIKNDTAIDSLQKKIDRIKAEPQLYANSVAKLFDLIAIKNKKHETN